MKKMISALINQSCILSYLKLKIYQIRWRLLNKHNFTHAKNCFNPSYVSVGKYTYGVLDVRPFGNPKEKLTIGNFCSIGPDSIFLLGGEHAYSTMSTFPFNHYFSDEIEYTPTKGEIIIGDDVWIGIRCIIMSGVKIGKGSIIAAGSVVTKDVPPYSIVGGIPAKVIKYRFSDEIINKLSNFDYNQLDEITIKNNLDLFNCSISNENVNDIINNLINQNK